MFHIQGSSNMTGTNCDLFTHKSSRSYLNHLVCIIFIDITPVFFSITLNIYYYIILLKSYLYCHMKSHSIHTSCSYINPL
jgi:hypothetical protein